MTSHRSRARGFTLIELLIVICIIGLLIAILVPATAAVFEFSKLIQCRNNMSQIAKAAQQYSATHNQWILPAVYLQDTGGSPISDKLARTHWCNILVEGGIIDAPDTTPLGDSTQSTPKENVFRCPSSIDQGVTSGSAYPTGTSYADDAVCGFIRVGKAGKKIDCGYYWNGSSDTTPDTTLGKMAGQDFPSMAVPIGNRPNGQPLTMADIQAAPYLGMYKLDVLANVTHSTSTSNISGGAASLSVTTVGNLTIMIMLTDGVGMDAGSSNSDGSRARISAPHGGELGKRTITNVAYWDGHVEQEISNCTRLKVVPGDNSWQTKDPIWKSDGLKGAVLGYGYFRLSSGKN